VARKVTGKEEKGHRKTKAGHQNKCDDQKGPLGTMGDGLVFCYSLNLALIPCKMREKHTMYNGRKYRGMVD